MGLDLNYIEGQTPIDEDEKEGLLIHSITSRHELDEFEQFNIEKAVEWSISNKFTQNKILTEQFVKELHFRMFNEVWTGLESSEFQIKILGSNG
jgi:fido (protein-threonine AMPylation protein)